MMEKDDEKERALPAQIFMNLIVSPRLSKTCERGSFERFMSLCLDGSSTKAKRFKPFGYYVPSSDSVSIFFEDCDYVLTTDDFYKFGIFESVCEHHRNPILGFEIYWVSTFEFGEAVISLKEIKLKHLLMLLFGTKVEDFFGDYFPRVEKLIQKYGNADILILQTPR